MVSTAAGRTKVVFFDAVGTLFRVKGGVGHIYSSIAHEYGVHTDVAEVDRCFYRAFKAAPPAAFPNAGDHLEQMERDWWCQLVKDTFGQIGVMDQFTDFSRYFKDVFDIFATTDAWELYDETLPVLAALKDSGMPLAVISNFDSRLYAVLRSLGLDQWFSSVTISTLVGAAKPSQEVFKTALQQQGISPELGLHIGDSRKQDYLGAKQSGMQALWLSRAIPQIAPDSPPSISDEAEQAETITDLSGVLDCLDVAFQEPASCV